MANLLVTFIGAMMIIYLLSMLVEWALFARIFDNPRLGLLASGAAAIVVALIWSLSESGKAAGGPVRTWVVIVPAGLVVTVLRLMAHWRRAAQEAAEVAREDVGS